MSGNLLMKTRIVAVAEIAERIRSVEIEHSSRPALPSFTAGAHVLVETPAGHVRQYSLCSDPADTRRYRLGILNELESRGGSRSMHDSLGVGDILYGTRPRNDFPLSETGRHLLIAGGIGITPILAMAYELARRQSAFELHYCARDAARAAFLTELQSLCPTGNLHIHFDGGNPAKGLNLSELLSDHAGDVHLYVCGPKSFLDAAIAAAERWPSEHVHYERFSAVEPSQRAHGEAFEIEVMPAARIVPVGKNETALDALRAAGLAIASQCEGGICGTCRVHLIAGDVIHRDAVLSNKERADTMITCVSRGKGRVRIALIAADE
jgi:vanillate monooxygenase ferredoxin subunit